LDREFDDVYRHYPRRHAEKTARVEYHRQRRTVSRETIAGGVMRLAARCTGADPRYVPHFVKWLKEERWTDDPAQPTILMPIRGGKVNGHKPGPLENLYAGFVAAAGYDGLADRAADEPLLDRRRSAGD
jgi:hypothetical protein